MITVHKIETENIRSLGHAVFEPLTDGGLTALNGPNGAGKSSLLCALLWCLYGVTPDGVQQQAMRRQGSDGQPCRVLVDFEHDNQIVSVERGLKGRNDSPYMIIKVNGVEQARGKIRASEAWLVSLLGGLDAEGFMTAFVIRQKELDGLVKAKPAERRKLIERLAGIDRMSAAVKSAREEETDIKRRLEVLPGDPDAVKAAREEVERAQSEAVALWEAYEASQAAANDARTTYQATEAAARDMQTLVDAHAAAERAVSEAQHRLALAQQQQSTTDQALAEATRSAAGGTDEDVAAAKNAFDNANEAVNANKQARAAANAASLAANDATLRAEQERARADRARTFATELREQAAAAAARAASFPTDLADQITTAEAEHAATTERTGALRGEHGRLGASLALMQDADAKQACCPTCSTALADPAIVISSLTEARARVLEEGKKAAARVEELDATIKALRQQVSQAERAATEAKHFAEQADSAERAAAEAETTAAATAEQATQAADNAATVKAAAAQAEKDASAVAEALDLASHNLRLAQVAAAAAARLPALTTEADNAHAAVTAAQAALRAAETSERQQRAAIQDKDTVFNACRAAQALLANADRDMATAHGNFRVCEEQVKAAEKARDTEEMKLRARAEAFAELERKTAVREALDFFRKDRIASLAPELSEIATDSIGRMTDGKFVAVELDEEFTPVITDDQGRLRPASWLSGGEESAVALALRLAIGEVIAGSNGGLLWMDEPQTAMDAQRRPAMMSVIRDLTGRQPVIISHVSEATDMVDLVLEVVPDEENGSSVVMAGAATTVLDTSVLDTIDA